MLSPAPRSVSSVGRSSSSGTGVQTTPRAKIGVPLTRQLEAVGLRAAVQRQLAEADAAHQFAAARADPDGVAIGIAVGVRPPALRIRHPQLAAARRKHRRARIDVDLERPDGGIGLDLQHPVVAVECGSDDRPERRLLGDPDVAPRPDERWPRCEPGRPPEQRGSQPAEVPVPGHVRPPPGARLSRDLQERDRERARRRSVRVPRAARATCARRTSNRSAARARRRGRRR